MFVNLVSFGTQLIDKSFERLFRCLEISFKLIKRILVHFRDVFSLVVQLCQEPIEACKLLLDIVIFQVIKLFIRQLTNCCLNGLVECVKIKANFSRRIDRFDCFQENICCVVRYVLHVLSLSIVNLSLNVVRYHVKTCY